MAAQFGRALRPLFELAPDAAFVNHGSFGACPKEVLAEQDRIRRAMEAEPDAFFRQQVMPDGDGATALRAAISRLAALVGTTEARMAFIENATAGIQAVLRSIAFAPGDRILVTDHTYNAVRIMVEERCRETGAEPLVVPIAIPASANDMVSRVVGAASPSVKLAILDHITSASALVFPLDRIIPELRARGIRVLVDGAHAVGQIALDLPRLGPDWYVSNAHKWLYAPKGTAFLYAAEEVAAVTRPNVVSHFHAMGFPRAFDYTGTRDNSGWLATPAAIDFFERLDPPAARAYQSGLLRTASVMMASLGAQPVSPLDLCASMRSFVLPQQRPAAAEDAPALMRATWQQGRVQSHASVLGARLITRVSAQVYVDDEDLARLRDTLERHGWPGR
jgi:isopenicillin-N epimerase